MLCMLMDPSTYTFSPSGCTQIPINGSCGRFHPEVTAEMRGSDCIHPVWQNDILPVVLLPDFSQGLRSEYGALDREVPILHSCTVRPNWQQHNVLLCMQEILGTAELTA